MKKVANEQNLIPNEARTPRERSEIAAKGGRATKGLRRHKQMKCKNCNLTCSMQAQILEKEPDSLCKIPKVKKLVMESLDRPEKIDMRIVSLITEVDIMTNSLKDKKDLIRILLDTRKTLNPATEKHEYTDNMEFDFNKIIKIAQENNGKKIGTDSQ